MKILKGRRRARRHERGSILAFTGMALLTLVGMTVVGVDLGRLAFTATEVQTVAEVAATGYAHAWLKGVINPAVGDPGDSACAAEALPVVGKNKIDGTAAAAANIEPYQRGFYDFGTSTFTTAVPAGETANAVRATANTTVNNIFASLFGAAQSTVRKEAVAALTCGSRSTPLPLAVQDCQFEAFDGPDDCSELPELTEQTINVDNACWAAPLDESFNIVPWIRALCGLNGQTETPPSVQQGELLNVSEGNHTTACQAVRDCWDAGVTKFTVAIVPCFDESGEVQCASHGSGNLPVTGFASIELSSRPVCTGTPKTFTLHSFCNAPPIDGVGGNCSFGNFKVAMVQ